MSASILILHEDSRSRRFMTAVLDAEGHRVRHASLIAEAWLALAAEPVDLAIVHCELPDGKGLDFIAALRQRDREVKLMLTCAPGAEIETTMARIAELGVGRLVALPLSPDELLLQLDGLLGRRLQGGAGPSAPSEPEQAMPRAGLARAGVSGDSAGADLSGSYGELELELELEELEPAETETEPLEDLPRAGPGASDEQLGPGPQSRAPRMARAPRGFGVPLGALEQELIALNAAYAARLEVRLARLGELLAAARARPGAREPLLEARTLSHRMHGTAGSYGFGEVGDAAAAIEQALDFILQGSAPAGPELWRHIGDSFALAKAAFDRGRSALPGARLPRAGVQQISIARVLVVDDDPDFLASLEMMGRSHLIKVIAARSGREALRKARGRKVDGAVVDIFLDHGDNAFRLVEELRSLPHQAALPVAFTSSDSSISNRIAAAQAGASLFLPKPLAAEEFVAAVRHLQAQRTKQQPRVLIVDDDEDVLNFLMAALRGEQMQVTPLSDSSRILDVLDQVRPDLILFDAAMAQINGFDVCRMLRSTSKWQDLPIILLTDAPSAELRIAAFDAGADDYLPKPIVREELLARLRLRLERLRLARERSDRDSLTGLFVRHAFVEMAGLRLSEARRRRLPISLCLIDLDRFKDVNDSYGHQVGDRVLSSLGKLLSTRFRSEDVRGRWGGEEFALVFVGESAGSARSILSRTLAEFRRLSFRGDRGELFGMTFSGGIASFPEDGALLEELIRAADQRLYLAKGEGRNRIRV